MNVTPIPQPEWIKFAGSDVYHLATARRFRCHPPMREARCDKLGHPVVRWIAVNGERPEPLCPNCLLEEKGVRRV